MWQTKRSIMFDLAVTAAVALILARDGGLGVLLGLCLFASVSLYLALMCEALEMRAKGRMK